MRPAETCSGRRIAYGNAMRRSHRRTDGQVTLTPAGDILCVTAGLTDVGSAPARPALLRVGGDSVRARVLSASARMLSARGVFGDDVGPSLARAKHAARAASRANVAM